MRISGIVFLFLLLRAFSQEANAQACADYHTRACPIPDFSYYYDQQSTSVSLRVGEKAEVNIVVFELTDYFVSVCSHRKFKNINLRILDDASGRKVLFDNAAESYVDSVKFTNNATKKLILEILVPEEGNDKSDTRERCVGVLVAKRINVDAF
ncbi:MAG: hypothetical protein RBT19_09960 [Tenuifilaceae bacterium]|jgi:hypothetical protein|uniref:hypothetical protein n=1 Tax=Perlabentimonas gracilis TaxID=2715279 RepID=UPI0014095FEA|nr:hypothetical protein [Perlabentimonas gracilis]MDX9770679.1 hypothetical protein [Tenuifilaceae bacterium]NHB68003.1 hypothetical protein [Perlabentimonas gracilis]